MEFTQKSKTSFVTFYIAFIFGYGVMITGIILETFRFIWYGIGYLLIAIPGFIISIFIIFIVIEFPSNYYYEAEMPFETRNKFMKIFKIITIIFHII